MGREAVVADGATGIGAGAAPGPAVLIGPAGAGDAPGIEGPVADIKRVPCAEESVVTAIVVVFRSWHNNHASASVVQVTTDEERYFMSNSTGSSQSGMLEF